MPLSESDFLKKLGFSYCRGGLKNGINRHYVSNSIGGIEIVIGIKEPKDGWMACGAGYECNDGLYIQDALKGLIRTLVDADILNRNLPILGHFDDLRNPYANHPEYEDYYKRSRWLKQA